MKEEGLTLVEHLTELRKRIIIVIITLFLSSIAAFYFVEEIQHRVIRTGEGVDFVYLSPPELLMAHIRLAITVGFVVVFPIILFQIWAFVIPGVGKKQKWFLFFAIFFGTLFFLGGMVFAYFLIIPLSVEFFVGMASESVRPMFSFTSYVGFISSILLAFGIAFELPMLILLLTKFNLVKPKLLRKFRKYVFLGVVILSAVLTPPDVISQILLAGPMMLLFELSIWVSEVIYRKKLREKE